MLFRSGFGGLTIAAVAEMAEVGKGTIYLRWPDKESLVASALADAWGPVEDPDTGKLRDDLIAIVTAASKRMNGEAGALAMAVVGELGRYPALRTLYVNDLNKPWIAVMVAIVERGIARGQARKGTDPVAVARLVLSPTFATGATRGARLTGKDITALVDTVLKGVAP